MTDQEMRDKHYKEVLIDADYLVYAAASSGENTFYIWKDVNGNTIKRCESAKQAEMYKKEAEEFFNQDTSEWVREVGTELRPESIVYSVLDHMIAKLKTTVNADKYTFFIGGEGNFRYELATLTPYKGERKTEKPFYFQEARQHIMRKYKAKVVNGIEADDAVSVNLYNDWVKTKGNPTKILVHVDKDINMTCGVHYNPDKNLFYFISPEDADYNFALQMVTGDTVDNIIGLPNLGDEFRDKYSLPKRNGAGKKTAELILQDLKGSSLQVLYARVLEAYSSFYTHPYKYTNWKGETVSASPEQLLDENCGLLYMMRKKGEQWLTYKERTFVND